MWTWWEYIWDWLKEFVLWISAGLYIFTVGLLVELRMQYYSIFKGWHPIKQHEIQDGMQVRCFSWTCGCIGWKRTLREEDGRIYHEKHDNALFYEVAGTWYPSQAFMVRTMWVENWEVGDDATRK